MQSFVLQLDEGLSFLRLDNIEVSHLLLYLAKDGLLLSKHQASHPPFEPLRGATSLLILEYDERLVYDGLVEATLGLIIDLGRFLDIYL